MSSDDETIAPAERVSAPPRAGPREGFRRLLIVAAVLWFGFWGIRAWVAYWHWQDTITDGADVFYREAPAFHEFVGQIIAAFLFPALAYAIFLVARWVYRGFRRPS